METEIKIKNLKVLKSKIKRLKVVIERNELSLRIISKKKNPDEYDITRSQIEEHIEMCSNFLDFDTKCYNFGCSRLNNYLNKQYENLVGVNNEH